MPDLERLSRIAYATFSQKSNAFGGMSWNDLSSLTRDAWRAVASAVADEINSEVPEISPPLFASLDTFDLAALQKFREDWRRLQRNPEWAFWHNHAPKAIEAIEAEIQRRSNDQPN
jgi:hypothetical protein